MDIRESLNDQIYISSFNDPTVALETTQSNQTYAFEQNNQSYGDVEDEILLSPDWNKHYYYQQDQYGNTYTSTDQLEWELLQPTSLEDLPDSPDQILNQQTTLTNDFKPVQRSQYALDLSYPSISTMQTQAGKLTVPAWNQITSRRSAGHSDRS
jgi:hypothetical protein